MCYELKDKSKHDGIKTIVGLTGLAFVVLAILGIGIYNDLTTKSENMAVQHDNIKVTGAKEVDTKVVADAAKQVLKDSGVLPEEKESAESKKDTTIYEAQATYKNYSPPLKGQQACLTLKIKGENFHECGRRNQSARDPKQGAKELFKQVGSEMTAKHSGKIKLADSGQSKSTLFKPDSSRNAAR